MTQNGFVFQSVSS